MPTLDAHAPAFRKPHQGISTPALLVTLSIAVLLAIAALNLAQLSHQRHQIQIGADAAALAATAQLQDRRWLYLGPGDPGDEDVAAKLPQLGGILDAQIDMAQTAAEQFAFQNKVANQPIRVDADDVSMGFVAEPAERVFVEASSLEMHDGFNSLIVKASRRKSAGNLPMLWMASQLGLEKLEMKIYSQAVIDQRVYGLRPITARDTAGLPTGETHVPVPIVPIAVMPDTEDLCMDVPETYPENLWWAKGPRDEFIVVPERQQVTPDNAGDGIAEFVIRIPCSDCTGDADDTVNTREGALLAFGGAGTGPAAILHVSRNGLQAEDLLPHGELNLNDPNNLPIFPANYNVTSDDLTAIRAGLLSTDTSLPRLIGAPRIFPIGAPYGNDEFAIAGFVAGTIVDCTRDSDGSLLLVVQPCVLQSPTALVAGVVNNDVIPRNPWIGKLLLNR